MIEKKQSLSDLFRYYMDIRMPRILLLGAISGFPWVLIGSSLSLWLKEEGLSRSTIGWAGLIFGVYAFNYLWAPIIDRIQIPFLTKKTTSPYSSSNIIILPFGYSLKVNKFLNSFNSFSTHSEKIFTFVKNSEIIY